MILTFTVPFNLSFAMYFIIARFGAIGLVGFAGLLVFNFIQVFISNKAANFMKKRNKFADERIKISSEAIDGIRTIKMYGWEDAISKILIEKKVAENNYIAKMNYLIFTEISVSSFSSVFSFFLLLIIYVKFGNEIDYSLIFSSLQIFDFLKTYCILHFSKGISGLFELKVIIERIVEIMNIEETKEENKDNLQVFNNEKEVIVFNNYNSSWKEENLIEENLVLKNINFSFEKSKSYAIIGKIGCSKTSFLLSILKNIPYYSGNIFTRGKIAYVEQEPFIISGTIRDNILFGNSMNESLYSDVIIKCCLKQDLNEFQEGDLTEIGEKGRNLSGGQKARLSLARALYSQADIYLLDDPISALDSKIAKKIFDNIILDFLIDKTVILTTHQYQFARKVDEIILLENGKIIKHGTYNDFENEFAESIADVNSRIENSINISNYIIQKEKRFNRKRNKYVKNEELEKVETNFKVYKNYFTYSKSYFLIFLLLFIIISIEIVRYYIYRILGQFNSETFKDNKNLFFAIVGGLVLLILLISIFRGLIFVNIFLKNNKKIYDLMTMNILKTFVTFFDRNPTGRILNRFSNDMSMLDNMIIYVFSDILDYIFYFFAILITIMTFSIYFLIPVFALIFVYYFFFKFCRISLKELKKLDLIHKGPLFSYFSYTIDGFHIIKVYEKEDFFKNNFKNLIKNYIRTNNAFWLCSRAFGAYVELFANLCSGIGLFICILTINDPGIFAQAILYLNIYTEFTQWLFRQLITFNTMMASAVRTMDYSSLENEGKLILETDNSLKKIKNKEKIKNWDIQGEISFKNVNMRYSKNEGDFILKNLSFKISQGEKIGCVGRTGAGKSSILQTLLRMYNIDNSQQSNNIPKGVISIDGVNIHNIGLHTLRKNISIIPQNPFLFSGTIKRNLDPMGIYNIKELWNCLKEVGLDIYVKSLTDGIETDMTNANSIFSVGQKQLICLARTILMDNKILLLDEATANVDLETDKFVQKTIKEKFKNCTVFTIAHRLLTIADYDKILVLEKGNLAEFDHPFKLLALVDEDKEITRNSIFAKLVQNTGKESAQKIFDISKTFYLEKLK